MSMLETDYLVDDLDRVIASRRLRASIRVHEDDIKMANRVQSCLQEKISEAIDYDASSIRVEGLTGTIECKASCYAFNKEQLADLIGRVQHYAIRRPEEPYRMKT